MQRIDLRIELAVVLHDSGCSCTDGVEVKKLEGALDAAVGQTRPDVSDMEDPHGQRERPPEGAGSGGGGRQEGKVEWWREVGGRTGRTRCVREPATRTANWSGLKRGVRGLDKGWTGWWWGVTLNQRAV
eukprot:TRINITY_DN8792_c0_g1_i1.p2 TRINITY_DN8792_c0_g1~~TRINITY_DN8792_c0_g1_i1.p2  ORF type:complete len:129 (+),score=24.75 TRINITY_DN8792_c0_g1_i1:378-764(+)